MSKLNETPTLSLIVTCYNIEKYLDECLETVVNQTLQDIEIIVVDDGSSDGTVEIIEKFAKKDARIKPVLLGVNSIGGVATAANAGLDVATGKYIGFADGDDFYDLQMFEILVNNAEEHSSDLAMCKYKLHDDLQQTDHEPAEQKRWLDFLETTHVDLSNSDNTKTILKFIAVPWRKIYRRDLIENNNIRYPVGDYFWEDNPFHWLSACAAKSIVLVPQSLCSHRVNRIGQTMGTVDAKLLRMFEHFDTIEEWLRKKDLLKTYEAELVAWGVSQFEWIQHRIPEEVSPQLQDILKNIVVDRSQAVMDLAMAQKGQKTRNFVNSLRSDMNVLDNGNRKPSYSRSLIAIGKQSLREKGVLRTAELVAKFGSSKVKKKFGRLKVKGKIDNKGQSKSDLTSEEVYVLFSLLQTDINRKHAELLAEIAKLKKR